MRRKAFTLIELLVVIAIIGLLSSIVLVSMSGVRGKARDAQRYSDLATVQLALEMYYDTNGNYPSTSGTWRTVCNGALDTTTRGTTGATGYIPNLAPTYVGQLPVDPSGCPTGVNGYAYRSTGTDYKFVVYGTAEEGKLCATGQKYDDPVTGRGQTYCAIYTSGTGVNLW